mgnify:CR=1 FL=1
MPLAAISQVPSQCTDVMLQGFYYQSFSNKGYGDTRWITLLKDSDEIGTYFDLVWLPPSASSSDDLGYHPAQYSNQSSNKFGAKTYLLQLINSLHRHNTKVIADIVINHAGNKSNWCNYYTMDFGDYGSFSPNSYWITSNDEVWSAGQSACNVSSTANADDGYGSEANYGSARDWDHKNTNVQDMFKAYLKWMRNVITYDGWRYDYCVGYHTSHIDDYNKASTPYLSVMEYWNGNAATLRTRLAEANYNTMTFDFAAKYTIYNNGIAQGVYTNCKSNGMRALGLTKYAVTFIDNHDTHNRNNGAEFAGNNSITNNPNKILQANAYMLSMPGVPCVFYPHWVTFKDEIKKMITARKLTGVHSESKVTEEAGSGYYRATVQGLKGTLIVKIGQNSGYNETPNGYTCATNGNNYGVYYKLNNDAVESMEELSGVYSDNNELHIEGHENEVCSIYNISGQLVKQFAIADYHSAIQLPQAGLYMVRIGNQSTKVSIIK